MKRGQRTALAVEGVERGKALLGDDQRPAATGEAVPQVLLQPHGPLPSQVDPRIDVDGHQLAGCASLLPGQVGASCAKRQPRTRCLGSRDGERHLEISLGRLRHERHEGLLETLGLGLGQLQAGNKTALRHYPFVNDCCLTVFARPIHNLVIGRCANCYGPKGSDSSVFLVLGSSFLRSASARFCKSR